MKGASSGRKAVEKQIGAVVVESPFKHHPRKRCLPPVTTHFEAKAKMIGLMMWS